MQNEGTGYRERRLAFVEGDEGGDFGWAMAGVLRGASVRRKDWNRPAYITKKSRVDGFTHAAIIMVMKDGTVGHYTPSGCDMVACDWAAVDVEPWSPGPESTAHKRGGETW